MKKLNYLLFFAMAIACSRKQIPSNFETGAEKAGLTTNQIDAPFLQHSVQYAFYSDKEKTMIFTSPFIDLSSNVNKTGATITGTRNISCLDVDYAVLGTYPATFTSAGKFVLPKECQKDWNGSLADGLNGKLYSYFKIQGLIPLFTAVAQVKPEFTLSSNPFYTTDTTKLNFENAADSLTLNFTKNTGMDLSQIDTNVDYTLHLQIQQKSPTDTYAYEPDPITLTGKSLYNGGNDFKPKILFSLAQAIIYAADTIKVKGYLLKDPSASSDPTKNNTLALAEAVFAHESVTSTCVGAKCISTAADFSKLNNSSDAFELTNDIDMSTLRAPFLGITGFTGELDGKGFTIRGLSMSTATAMPTSENPLFIGFFPYLTPNTGDSIVIKNIIFDNSNINPTVSITGSGTLIGSIFMNGGKARIENITLKTGNVFSSNAFIPNTGGLIGMAQRQSGTEYVILKKITNENTTPIGTGNIGGIIGLSEFVQADSLSNTSSFTFASGNPTYGGIIGRGTNTTINNSSNNNTIQDNRSSKNDNGRFGGIVGHLSIESFINNCSSTLNSNTSGETGGLVGTASFSSSINNSTAEVNFSPAITTDQGIGRLVGVFNNNQIDNSSAKGNIVNTNISSNTGGLIGQAAGGGVVKNSYSQVNVSGGNNVGGLLGAITGDGIDSLLNSYATGNITGANGVGGLIGRLDLSNNRSIFIHNVYSTGQYTALVGSNHGGLIGFVRLNNNNDVKIIKSYSTKSIETSTTTSESGNIGGFIGQLQLNNSTTTSVLIDSCYSTGNVKSNYNVGGFIGSLSQINKGTPNSTQIKRSYAGGSAVETNNKGGSFVGYSDIQNSLLISDCFGTANVTGGVAFGIFNSTSSFSDNIIINCYASGTSTQSQFISINYTLTNSGLYYNSTNTTISLGTPLNPTNLQQSQFVGFDFINTWQFNNASTWPTLKL